MSRELTFTGLICLVCMLGIITLVFGWGATLFAVLACFCTVMTCIGLEAGE